VTVRTGERQVALAVSAVEGLVSLETHAFEESAPLLGLCRDNAIAELATRDGQLVFLLETSRLVEKCPSVLPEGSP
jgi:chemotaxis signal transduction protein